MDQIDERELKEFLELVESYKRSLNSSIVIMEIISKKVKTSPQLGFVILNKTTDNFETGVLRNFIDAQNILEKIKQKLEKYRDSYLL